jgi:RNA polymerase sigma factor (sigma-70 family)
MQTYLPPGSAHDPQFVLWVSPLDDRKVPVDPVFIDAAACIGRGFLRYRARELNDESRALELAERAVHLCSRANKRKPVDDPVAYLFRTFSNLIDRELDRLGRFLPWLDDFLYVAGKGQQEELEREIEWREILESLDEPIRSVFHRLRSGFTVNEIANQLGISPEALSQRLSRARKKLKETLDPGRPSKGRSSVDDARKKDPRSH